MKALPHTSDLTEVARLVIWFESPEQALADTPRFVTYAMTYGSDAEMRVLRRYLSDDELRAAMDAAPPGIFDARSWAYWNLRLGRYPAPPMPARRFT